jgi:hypothetical protein
MRAHSAVHAADGRGPGRSVQGLIQHATAPGPLASGGCFMQRHPTLYRSRELEAQDESRGWSHGHAAGRLGSVPSIFRVDGSVRRKGDRSAYDHRLAPSRQLRHIHLCGRRSLRMGSGRPGGSAVVEAGPGDFLHVPKGAIHREGQPGRRREPARRSPCWSRSGGGQRRRTGHGLSRVAAFRDQ